MKKNIYIIALVLVVFMIGILFFQNNVTSTYKAVNTTEPKDGKAKNEEKPNVTFELMGEGDIVITLGDEYIEQGYIATDSKGNSVNIEVNLPDFNKAGKHKVEYIYKDNDNTKVLATRNIIIEPNINLDTNGIAICMYHYIYDDDNPPEKLNSNYISLNTFKKELDYLIENEYYFPTWNEVKDYIDGKQILPDNSIVITFDDGRKQTLEYMSQLTDEYKIPMTSFLITKNDGQRKVEKFSSRYLNFQSHSHDMHRPGGSIGHGGIFTALSVEEGVADLKKSIEICGSSDAFAYPFGDYSDSSRQAIEQSGFLCAFTTEYGKVYPGNDPFVLPRIRMSNGQSLSSFIKAIN
ncbi:polysaccharide deacetylase family protein [Alkalibaculum sp. M08DMB]|uniref:Polysaccharide deacetylase family protein n=1 Tax=Alkalibaculum sporogenes TaxID=2655001 RepID=A0A6A7KEC8_9FIRM|nr:polysaccharide deacetylase family protein [Alkalibaculum sporogenes]MPW27333.1 polysaccharide deacetylase family protein [Alkalibaculum sporogenes]